MSLPDLRHLAWRAPATVTVLRLRGRDVRSLLHRISTRDLADLPPGEARATLFCDFRGRLLQGALVLGTDDGVLLLRDDAGPDDLRAWVDRHVFQDDCTIEDLAPAWTLRRAWHVETPALPEESVHAVGPETWIIAAGPSLLWAVGEARALDAALDSAPPSGQAEEKARIVAGWPAQGREIRDEFSPYEVGLAHRVHLAKGCYTGQEALQRLMTYGSVRRGLARVRGSGAPPAPLPYEIRRGETRGVVTSAVPDAGGWIGLAVVPLAWMDEGEVDAMSFDAIAARAPLGRA